MCLEAKLGSLAKAKGIFDICDKRSVTHKVKIFIVTSLNGITSNPEFDHFQICLQF